MRAPLLALLRVLLAIAARVCWRLAVYDNWHFARASEEFEALAGKLSDWNRWAEELQ